MYGKKFFSADTSIYSLGEKKKKRGEKLGQVADKFIRVLP